MGGLGSEPACGSPGGGSVSGVRITLAVAGALLAASPALTWYTEHGDAGPVATEDGWTAFTGIAWLVVAAGVAGVLVAALPHLGRAPLIVSRAPTLLAAVAAITVARHIETGPNDGGPTDPTAAIYAAAALAVAVAFLSFAAVRRE